MMTITEVLRLVSVTLLNSLSDVIIIIVFVSLASILITKAFTTVHKTVLLNNHLGKKVKFIFNTTTVLLFSILTILLFSNISSVVEQAQYIIIVFVMSWSTSIIVYDFIVIFLFGLFGSKDST